MDYATAIQFLYGLQGRGIKLGLERMQQALQARGYPEKRLRFVHVAGTNGKGSVSAMLASCLRHAGCKTGLFTSPHLHRFTERIQIDGQEMSANVVAHRISELAQWQRDQSVELSFFEMTTLLALEYFADEACDIVVMETGLGGRLDSTNVILPELCIITHIAHDHCGILGEDLPQIATEKAGIIKTACPVILGDSPPDALEVLVAQAHAQQAPIVQWDRDIEIKADTAGTLSVRVQNEVVSELNVALSGIHQRHNAAVVVAACLVLRQRGWKIPTQAIRDGLCATRWPGRLEFVGTAPQVLLDAAHNPDSCQALADFLRTISARFSRLVLVFGCMQDKDAKAMLRCFEGLFAQQLYVAPPMPRAVVPNTLQKLSPGVPCQSIADALSLAQEQAGTAGLVVVAGSIFVVAEARRLLLGIPSEPPIGM